MSINGGVDCQVLQHWNESMVLFVIIGFIFALIPKTQCIGHRKLGFFHPCHIHLLHL